MRRSLLDDEEVILSAGPVQSETVTTGELVTPVFQQFTRFIVDKDVVLRFVGEQDDPPFTILYHFMAIVHRIL